MDWNRPGKLIRPNPDWEEDLFQTVVVGPAEEARVNSYTAKYKKRKPKKPCFCQERNSPGVAPLLTLNNGQMIPNMGLGTWLGVDSQGIPIPVTNLITQRTVEAAIDAGYRLIDTSPRYRNEDQVGRAIKKKIAEGVVKRKDLFIVSKLWNDCHAKEAVVPALKQTLANLGLDYLDLYLIHWPIGLLPDGSYDPTDYLETWEGMVEARARALTTSIGVSNFNQHQLDRVISLSKMKPAAIQIEINLTNQQLSLLTFCRTRNIAVIAHTPFGSLFYARAAPDAPPPRADSPAVCRIADKYHKTVPQIALRYLIELGVIPIPKSVNPNRIESNIEVFDFQLRKTDRNLLKEFDKGYRTLPVRFWQDSPYYPFHK